VACKIYLYQSRRLSIVTTEISSYNTRFVPIHPIHSIKPIHPSTMALYECQKCHLKRTILHFSKFQRSCGDGLCISCENVDVIDLAAESAVETITFPKKQLYPIGIHVSDRCGQNPKRSSHHPVDFVKTKHSQLTLRQFGKLR